MSVFQPTPDGVDEFAYLEFHDSNQNAHKFYQISREGKLVHYQWGRVGTKGQHQVKEFGSAAQASSAFHDRLRRKGGEGYEDTPRPSGAPEIPLSGPTQTQDLDDSRDDNYFVEWSVEETLEEEALQEACTITQSVLAEVPHLDTNIKYVEPHGVTGGHVKFFAGGEHVGSFGFPPQEFLDSLTQRERRAVLEMGTSRDGWLSATGKGQGVINTDMSMWDFTVRVFLSVLTVKHGVEVSCSSDHATGMMGLRVDSTDHGDFAWYPHWKNVIKPAVQKHWFVEGDSNVVVLDDDDADAMYAW